MPDATTTRSRAASLSEEEARALLEEQARSGLSFADFARSRNLSRQRLSWWKAKFAGKHVDRSRHPAGGRGRARSTTPRFVPVVVHDDSPRGRRRASAETPAPTASGAYELALGAALTLRIPRDFEEDVLTRLVRVLQAPR